MGKFENRLKGRVNDNPEWQDLRADASTHTLQIIDYAHHEIHSGSMYRVQHNSASVGAGNSINITFKTGSKEPHFTFEWIVSAKGTIELIEDPDVTMESGTDVAPKNSNRNSTNTSQLQGCENAAWTAGYVSTDATVANGTTISVKKAYAAKGDTTQGSRRSEIILATDTPYTLKYTNNDTSAASCQVRCEWYEHTNRSS